MMYEEFPCYLVGGRLNSVTLLVYRSIAVNEKRQDEKDDL
jgi:hypothetical protein